MGKKWVRFNADDYMWEVVEGRDRVICKTNTEKEAKELIMKGIK